MKKNKLYIANKWNQPAFMPTNRFDWGGLAAADKKANPWNYADDADITQQYMNSKNIFGISKADNPFSKGNLAGGLGAMVRTPIGGALIGGLAGPVGQVGGNLISGGLQSGAGKAISGVGSTVGIALGSVNPVLGGIVSVGSGLIGGLTNRMFGTKVDQAKLDAVNAGTDALRNFTSTATSLDDVQGPDAVAKVLDPYSGGWFSSGEAARKNEELRRQRADAKSWAERGVVNNIDNLVKSQMDDALANYAAFGGPLHSNGIDWTNGLILVDQGGTHEENPNEGVQMGVSSDGIPNLVEEGEVIWNDYVFSNRVKVPEDVKKKYKLRGSDDMTFADAARKAQKPSAERPNDLIEMRSLEDIMAKLMMEQEKVRAKKAMRESGKATELLFSDGGKIHIKKANNGLGGHLFDGTNPYTPQYLDWFDSYYKPSYQKEHLITPRRSNSKAQLMWSMQNPDPRSVVINTTRESLPSWVTGEVNIQSTPKLTPMQQIAKDKTAQRTDDAIVTVDNSGLGFNLIRPNSTIDFDGKIKVDDEKGGTSGKYNPLTALRYVPALGASIGVFSDLMGWTNKPDYSNANMILDASRNVRDISYKPIGDYLTYRPLDRLFYSNILGAQAGATRRNILNTSGGNRGTAMAGLLAADYNAQNQLGNLFRQAEEYNLAQRQKVADFNRATNMFNSEADLKAQMANTDIGRLRLDATKTAAGLRQAADAQSSAARNANLTNLFDSLGNIGREEVMKSWINENPALYYAISNSGAGTPFKKSKSKGGCLTIKRRK